MLYLSWLFLVTMMPITVLSFALHRHSIALRSELTVRNRIQSPLLKQSATIKQNEVTFLDNDQIRSRKYNRIPKYQKLYLQSLNILKILWQNTVGKLLRLFIQLASIWKKKNATQRDNKSLSDDDSSVIRRQTIDIDEQRSIDILQEDIMESEVVLVRDIDRKIDVSSIMKTIPLLKTQENQEVNLVMARKMVEKRLEEIAEARKTTSSVLSSIDTVDPTVEEVDGEQLQQRLSFSTQSNTIDNIEDTNDGSTEVSSSGKRLILDEKVMKALESPTIVSAASQYQPTNSLSQIKSAGISGIIAYVLTELGFWTLYPLTIYAYQSITGDNSGVDTVDGSMATTSFLQNIDFSNSESSVCTFMFIHSL